MERERNQIIRASRMCNQHLRKLGYRGCVAELISRRECSSLLDLISEVGNSARALELWFIVVRKMVDTLQRTPNDLIEERYREMREKFKTPPSKHRKSEEESNRSTFRNHSEEAIEYDEKSRFDYDNEDFSSSRTVTIDEPLNRRWTKRHPRRAEISLNKMASEHQSIESCDSWQNRARDTYHRERDGCSSSTDFDSKADTQYGGDHLGRAEEEEFDRIVRFSHHNQSNSESMYGRNENSFSNHPSNGSDSQTHNECTEYLSGSAGEFHRTVRFLNQKEKSNESTFGLDKNSFPTTDYNMSTQQQQPSFSSDKRNFSLTDFSPGRKDVTEDVLKIINGAEDVLKIINSETKAVTRHSDDLDSEATLTIDYRKWDKQDLEWSRFQSSKNLEAASEGAQEGSYAKSEVIPDENVEMKLAIIPVNFPFTILSKEQQISIEAQLSELILTCKYSALDPRFSELIFKHGYVEITCCDLATAHWVVRNKDKLKIENCKINIIDADKIKTFLIVIASIRLCENEAIEHVLGYLRRQNHVLNVYEWELVSTSCEFDCGTLLEIAISVAGFQELQANNFEVNCKFSKIALLPKGGLPLELVNKQQTIKSTDDSRMLLIVPMGFPNQSFTENERKLIEDKLLDLIRICYEFGLYAKFKELTFVGGFFQLMCCDRMTEYWVQMIMSQKCEVPFKVLNEDQIPSSYFVAGNFRSSSLDSTDDIMNYIRNQNRLVRADRWKIVDRACKSDGTVAITFSINRAALRVLKNQNYVIFYKFRSVKLRIFGPEQAEVKNDATTNPPQDEEKWLTILPICLDEDISLQLLSVEVKLLDLIRLYPEPGVEPHFVDCLMNVRCLILICRDATTARWVKRNSANLQLPNNLVDIFDQDPTQIPLPYMALSTPMENDEMSPEELEKIAATYDHDGEPKVATWNVISAATDIECNFIDRILHEKTITIACVQWQSSTPHQLSTEHYEWHTESHYNSKTNLAILIHRSSSIPVKKFTYISENICMALLRPPASVGVGPFFVVNVSFPDESSSNNYEQLKRAMTTARKHHLIDNFLVMGHFKGLTGLDDLDSGELEFLEQCDTLGLRVLENETISSCSAGDSLRNQVDRILVTKNGKLSLTDLLTEGANHPIVCANIESTTREAKRKDMLNKQVELAYDVKNLIKRTIGQGVRTELGILPFGFPDKKFSEKERHQIETCLLMRSVDEDDLLCTSHPGYLIVTGGQEKFVEQALSTKSLPSLKIVDRLQIPVPMIVTGRFKLNSEETAENVRQVLDAENECLHAHEWTVVFRQTVRRYEEISFSIDSKDFNALRKDKFLVQFHSQTVYLQPTEDTRTFHISTSFDKNLLHKLVPEKNNPESDFSSQLNPTKFSPTEELNSENFTQLEEGAVRMATWNVYGAEIVSKRRWTDEILRAHKIIIVCLQETHISSERISTNHYEWYLSPRAANIHAGGVAIVIKRDSNVIVEKFLPISENICMARLYFYHHSVLLICCYIPDDINGALNEYNHLKIAVFRERKSNPQSDIIVMGSFNGRVGRDDLQPEELPFINRALFHSNSNHLGLMLKNFVTSAEMRMITSCGPEPMTTWRSRKTGEHAQLDHILGTNKGSRMTTPQSRWLFEECVDHALISCDLIVQRQSVPFSARLLELENDTKVNFIGNKDGLVEFTVSAATWNAGAADSGLKRNVIDANLHEKGIAIACLQDTRLPTGQSSTCNYVWYASSGDNDETISGVAILVNRGCDVIVEQFFPISENLCMILLRPSAAAVDCKFFVINIKAPEHNIDLCQTYGLLKTLVLAAEKSQNPYGRVIMGDFNGHIGSEDLEEECLPYIFREGLHHTRSNTLGSMLKDFILVTKYMLCTMFCPAPLITWRSADGEKKAQLDHILTKSKGSLVEIYNIAAHWIEEVDTNHAVVAFTLNVRNGLRAHAKR